MSAVKAHSLESDFAPEEIMAPVLLSDEQKTTRSASRCNTLQIK
jgi:hypothetical protein